MKNEYEAFKLFFISLISSFLFKHLSFSASIEYKEITGQSIRLVGGEQCYTRIENGIAEMEALFANKRGAKVKALLKLCNDFDEYNDLDLWSLFSEIGSIFGALVQEHK